MSGVMMFAEGLLTREQAIAEFGIPQELESSVFSLLQPRIGDLFLKKDVNAALEEVLGVVNRPSLTQTESLKGEESFKVSGISQAVEPFERIAQGIERLIEVLVPRNQEPVDVSRVMLRPAEAAEQMKLNVQTVREWCREGKLGVKAGGKWLISRDEVKQYLRGQLLIKGRVAG